jgi:DNA-binding transcriptional MocR family regulator
MKHQKIDGLFVPHTRELLESPAWRILSQSARRLLHRIELEHLRHRGEENGRLPVTFNQFFEYGVHRHGIAPAIRECEALGLIQVTKRGTAANADFYAPNVFRLTYLPAGTRRATHEWRKIKTLDEAAILADAARKRPQQPRNQPIKLRIVHPSPAAMAASKQERSK